MPFGQPRFGATILGITNANPAVVTVDNSSNIFAGNMIRIANVVSGGISFNGDYLVQSVTPTTVTLTADTTSYGSYTSGGFLTLLDQEYTVPVLNYQPYVWTNLASNPSGYIPVGDIIPQGEYYDQLGY